MTKFTVDHLHDGLQNDDNLLRNLYQFSLKKIFGQVIESIQFVSWVAKVLTLMKWECLSVLNHLLKRKRNFNVTSRHHHHHVEPLARISLTLSRHSPYRSSPLAGLQGYIPYPHRDAVFMFELVVLLLLGHMCGSTGVHHLWAGPCFSSSVLHVWFV